MESNDVALVVCLCGIPGAGKSTYAERLASEHGVLVVSFDGCVSREDALQRLREAAAVAGQVVVADDNNYYKSMRKQVYRAARDAGAAYVQVLLEPPLAECLVRNARRSGAAHMPDEVVERMFGRLERPDGRGWDVALTGEVTLEQLQRCAVVPARPKAVVEPTALTSAEEKDLEMRREISRRVAAAPPVERAALAAALNAERKQKLKH
jgi:tRNA uridine 5-carbamoylmethylation protein Kti12